MSVTQVSTGVIADSSVTPAKLSQPLTSGTVQATTSGSAKTFGSIPSWVKRITVAFDGVSSTAAQGLTVTIGDSGGLKTSGYVCTTAGFDNASAVSTATGSSGFYLGSTADAAGTVQGMLTLVLIDASTNTWAAHGSMVRNSTVMYFVTGSISLTGTLTQLAFTSAGTFDAGKVNILYE